MSKDLESLQKLSLKSQHFIPMYFVTLAALVVLGKKPQTVPGIPVLDMNQVICSVLGVFRSSSTGQAEYLKSTCVGRDATLNTLLTVEEMGSAY